jgi:hypothetical protein
MPVKTKPWPYDRGRVFYLLIIIKLANLLKKRPLMEINLKSLVNILVNDRKFFYAWKECKNRREFKTYLRYTRLNNIKTIWVMYRLKDNKIMQFELKNPRANEWKVKTVNTPLFSFTFDDILEDQMNFFNVFETKLKEDFKKRSFVRPKTPQGKKQDPF